MKSSSVLRADIRDHRAAMDIIVQNSEFENRDLTLTESAECETRIATITSLGSQLEIAEKIEKEQVSLM